MIAAALPPAIPLPALEKVEMKALLTTAVLAPVVVVVAAFPALAGSYNKAVADAEMYSRLAESHMWSLGHQSGQADVCHVLGDAVLNWTLAAEGYEKALKSPADAQDNRRLTEDQLIEQIKVEKAKAANTQAFFEQTCR